MDVNTSFWRRVKALRAETVPSLLFLPPQPADLSAQLWQEALRLRDKAPVALALCLKPTGNVALNPGHFFCKGSPAVWNFSRGAGVMHVCHVVCVARAMRFL